MNHNVITPQVPCRIDHLAKDNISVKAKVLLLLINYAF